MSTYELHRTQAYMLLASKNEQLRKEYLIREKTKSAKQHVPLGWDSWYQIWLILALFVAFVINSPWGFELLFNDPVALRAVNLFWVGLIIAVSVFDMFHRECEITYLREEALPTTAKSECSDASSGTPSPSDSGKLSPSSPWRASWEAGTKSDDQSGASPTAST